MPDASGGPTNGELAIQLRYMTDLIEKMDTKMATKEFVNQKFEANNERVARVETDVKEWIQTSTAEHVRLDQEMQKQHDNLLSELDKRVGVVNGRIDNIEAEQKSQEQALKAQRNARAQGITVAIIGAILSVVGSVIASGVIRALFPVS
jgi:hypothetical protein